MNSSRWITNSKTVLNARRARDWRRCRLTRWPTPSSRRCSRSTRRTWPRTPGQRGTDTPTEAAWSLLEAVVEPWLEDITRRASIGLTEAARRIGLGVLEGLRRMGPHTRNDDLLVSWAPDFVAETADQVARVLADAGIDLTDAEVADAADGPL